MARRDAAKAVLEAVDYLDGLAGMGCLPNEVAAEAECIAARWWWQGQGEPSPSGLMMAIGELRRWCAVTSAQHAVRWERLCRAGRAVAAERAQRQAAGLDRARMALGVIGERKA